MRPGPAPLAIQEEIERAFRSPFGRSFYDRTTERVARDLLGQWLVRRTRYGLRAGRITETEAYVSGDAANHAQLGPTLRNRSMFGPPGTLYVYRVHQVHCANAVTGFGTAVLFRSIEPLLGISGDPKGPGRLCRELAIGPTEDGTSLVDGALRVVPGLGPVGRIVRGVRVGIRRDAARPLRFALAGSPWVSSPRMRA